MAGGYENEDRMAEMEELRQAREREMRDRLERERKEQEEARVGGGGGTGRESAKQGDLEGSSANDDTDAEGSGQ